MKYFIKPIAYLLGIHLAALVLLTLMRVCFYLSVSHMLTPDLAGQPALVATAFVRGLWFDNVIACYIMALPLVVGCVAGAFGLVRKWMLRAAGVWFGVWYTLVFMATAGNIPYFVYFSKVLNASIWNWAGYGGTTLGMIFGEPSYYLYIALFVVATALFSAFLWYMRHRALKHWPEVVPPAAYDLKSVRWWLSAGGKLLVGLALCGACFLGIRGRLGYNPIKVSAAYFCSSPVLNNVGVNPMFCLLNSTLDDLRPENRTLHLMPDAEAIRLVQQYYGRTGIKGISPIARRVEPDSQPVRRNVVVALMESMSAKLMGRFGCKAGLTPCLDSLYSHSLSFANCYSAGNHTNHGLYATLYSFPSIMFRNAMKGSSIPCYTGLPNTLKQAGYSTMFFMTHESQYDNMNAFFRTNGYDEIYAQENYPKKPCGEPLWCARRLFVQLRPASVAPSCGQWQAIFCHAAHHQQPPAFCGAGRVSDTRTGSRAADSALCRPLHRAVYAGCEQGALGAQHAVCVPWRPWQVAGPDRCRTAGVV